MKKNKLLFVLAFCLVFIGCNKHDAQVQAFIDERSAVVAQMCDKISTNPTEAGIDEARKIFDEKKVDLKAKWDDIQKAKVNFDLYSKLTKSEIFDSKMFTDVREKKHFASIPSLERKFFALQSDFNATFKK